MKLPKTRLAIQDAEYAVASLEAVKDDHDAFNAQFPATMAMLGRVGSILSEEGKGSAFKEWWNGIGKTPLSLFMKRVRNEELKEASNLREARHSLTISATARIVTNDGPNEPNLEMLEVTPEIDEKASQQLPAHTIKWKFQSKSRFPELDVFDGFEVLPMVRKYLDWCRDELLVTAEAIVDA